MKTQDEHDAAAAEVTREILDAGDPFSMGHDPFGNIDTSAVSSILDGTYEPSTHDHATARAFERAVRQGDELLRAFGGTPPSTQPFRGLESHRLSRGHRLGASLLSAFSRTLGIYAANGEVAPDGVTRSSLPRAVFLNENHPRPHAGAGHELWHSLSLSNPRFSSAFGEAIQEAVPEALLDHAAREFEKRYGAEGAPDEVAANLFSSVVTDPNFWDASGLPEGKRLAEELRQAGPSEYPQSRLISDRAAFVARAGELVRDHELLTKKEGGSTGEPLTGANTRSGRTEEAPSVGTVVESALGVKSSPFGPHNSLGPSEMGDRLHDAAMKRIKDPKAQRAIMKDIAAKMSELKSDVARSGVAFGKGYTTPAIEDPRKAASIAKEAAFREAVRRSELEDAAYAKHQGIIENDDLAKLKSQPVHEHLADPNSPLKGRLMSKSQAISRGETFFDEKKQGDYDGAGNVSRSVFGGRLMPDQAAQELYDHGLIKEPTPDAMWQALEKEQASVAKFKEHQKAAAEDMKSAREQAKSEAKAWQAARLKTEAKNYSPKARLLRALGVWRHENALHELFLGLAGNNEYAAVKTWTKKENHSKAMGLNKFHLFGL